MKKVLSLVLALAICLSLCACGGNGEASKSSATSDAVTEELSANSWRIQLTKDEFGDITNSSSAVMYAPINGDFSNTATASSELAGCVYMVMGEEYPAFVFRLLEYGDTPATFSSYDVITQKIKIGDKIYENEGVFGTPPNSDLMTHDTEQVLYSSSYLPSSISVFASL